MYSGSSDSDSGVRARGGAMCEVSISRRNLCPSSEILRFVDCLNMRPYYLILLRVRLGELDTRNGVEITSPCKHNLKDGLHGATLCRRGGTLVARYCVLHHSRSVVLGTRTLIGRLSQKEARVDFFLWNEKQQCTRVRLDLDVFVTHMLQMLHKPSEENELLKIGTSGCIVCTETITFRLPIALLMLPDTFAVILECSHYWSAHIWFWSTLLLKDVIFVSFFSKSCLFMML